MLSLLKTYRQLIDEKLTTPRDRKIHKTLTTLIIIGVIVWFLQVQIYRETIITWLIPGSIFICSGFVARLLTREYWKNQYFVSNFFIQVALSLASFGSITTYLFMAINYYPAKDNLKTETFPIIHKSSMSGPQKHLNKRYPLVYINYHGQKKELVLNYEDRFVVNNSDSVTIETYTGNLNFDIITKIWLLEKPKRY